MSTSPRTSERTAGRRGDGARLVAVLAAASTLVSVLQSAVIPLLPEMARRLDVGPDAIAWVVATQLLAGAVAAPLLGRLGDVWGRRPALYLTLGLVVAGCAISALFPSLLVLLVGRALHGCGSAALPLAAAVIKDELEPGQVPKALGTVSATISGGTALGPLVGGPVADLTGDYRAVFALLAVAGAAVLWACRAVPRRPGPAREPLDALGAFVFAVAITCLLVPLSFGGRWGWTSGTVLFLVLAHVVLMSAWVAHELRIPRPLIDLRRAVAPKVAVLHLAALLLLAIAFGFSVTASNWLQAPTGEAGGFGLSNLQASMFFVAPFASGVVVAPLASRAMRRFGPVPLWTATYATAGLGCILPAVTGDAQLWMLTTGGVLVFAAVSVGYMLIPTLIVEAIPARQLGAANGLNAVMRAVGGAVAAAAVAGVLGGSGAHVDGFVLSLRLWAVVALVAAPLALVLRRPDAPAPDIGAA